MRRTGLAAPAGLAALVTLAACGDADPDSSPGASGVTVRDSAGIRIFENHDSAWTEDTRWRLADEPDLVIGSVDGSVPSTDLSSIDDILVVDGRVVVEENRAREIRVFGPDGSWERTFGGSGEGPLEFSTIWTTGMIRGDSVVAFDISNRKVVAFPVSGGRGSPPRPSSGPGDPVDHGPVRRGVNETELSSCTMRRIPIRTPSGPADT